MQNLEQKVSGYFKKLTLPYKNPTVDDLRWALKSRGPGRTVVLTGLGGVGKTQLAADYGRQLLDARKLDLLVWINAANRDAILAGYAQAVDIAGIEIETVEEVAVRFRNWLERTDRRWLVVLDDLADPADLAELWPAGRTGQVVVTTRRRDPSLSTQGRIRIDVDLFTADEALAYLARRLGAKRRRGRQRAPAGSHLRKLEAGPGT